MAEIRTDGPEKGRPHETGRYRPVRTRFLDRRRRVLKRGLYLLDRRFLRRPQQYMVQAVMAAITLGILVGVGDALTNAATVTAIASSAFIIFMAPHASLAGPRRVLGGHAVGLAVGLSGFFIAHDVFGNTLVAQDVTAAAGVGISMLVMAGTDTEHPPAAGTVLGLVLSSDPFTPALMVFIAAVLLTGTRQLFQRWMIDLAH